MTFFIGNTDFNWYNFLRSRNPEDVNFWQPGGNLRFRAIPPGAPFLLRLKSPINKIAGVGFFSSQSLLPVDFAWEVFQERNGTGTYDEFYLKIDSFRSKDKKLRISPTIGCIVLTSPVFFDDSDWIPTPSDWSSNIVQGKTYSMESQIGDQIWKRVEMLVSKYQSKSNLEDSMRRLVLEDAAIPRYGKDYLSNPRLGQGAFRVLVTDTYSRKCAISGEKTLPVLEAAHIKPYEKLGPHEISNGLLLRSDIHKLFDKGYLTITPDFHIEISQRIKLEFENGRDYYKFHGNQLIQLPSLAANRPSPVFIEWHNSNIYKG